MPELVCAYYGTVVDATKPYWILERWEGGRVVARGAAGHPGASALSPPFRDRPRCRRRAASYHASKSA